MSKHPWSPFPGSLCQTCFTHNSAGAMTAKMHWNPNSALTSTSARPPQTCLLSQITGLSFLLTSVLHLGTTASSPDIFLGRRDLQAGCSGLSHVQSTGWWMCVSRARLERGGPASVTGEAEKCPPCSHQSSSEHKCSLAQEITGAQAQLLAIPPKKKKADLEIRLQKQNFPEGFTREML